MTKHVSEVFITIGVQILPCFGNSADLGPVGHAWHHVKNQVRSEQDLTAQEYLAPFVGLKPMLVR